MNAIKKTRIAFFDAKRYDQDTFDRINQQYGYGFELKYFEYKLNEETVQLSAGFNVVCAFVNDLISAPVIDILSDNGVKLVALRCAGYNNVDLKEAWGRLHVVRVPAYSPYAVAEHALALMMTLNRKTHKAYNRTRESNFALNGLLGFDMHGKTASVIGTGKIGKILIQILRGLGMRVLAYDVYPDHEFAKNVGVDYVDLNTIYHESDIISLNCPLTKETYHLINSKTISQMKDGVMIINTGRGRLIDTNALIEGLKSMKIGSAGLDVYEEEELYFFEDFSNQVIADDVLARLLSFNNVLLTGHQAFFTKEALENIALTTLENIKTYFDKDTTPNGICYKCDQVTCVKKEAGKCF